MSNATNLAAVFDEHLRDEFELHDAPATMTTMSESPHVYHLPTMAGGNGKDEVFKFYRDHFVTKWPRDTSTTHLSRTIGDDQLVDELVMHFTHDTVMDALLPGVAPTGKRVALPVVVIVKFNGGQGSARAHLLGPSVPTGASGSARSGTSARDGRRAGPKLASRHLRNESVLVARTHTSSA